MPRERARAGAPARGGRWPRRCARKEGALYPSGGLLAALAALPLLPSARRSDTSLRQGGRVSDAAGGRARQDPWRSRTPFALLIAAFAVALAGLGAWRESRRALESAYPPANGTLSVAGLRAPLEIVRDRRGVPHVRAQSEVDAWFGLGFAQAQDRLAQLVWLRRVALGRSAERIGEAGLASDRWARTLDFAGLAARDLRAASPEARRALSAYAAGVNAWIALLRNGELAAPPVALDEPLDEVEPWLPQHSLALAKQHAWALADPVAEILVLEQLVRSLGAGAARPLFPDEVGSTPPPAPAPSPAPASADALDARAVALLSSTRRALGLSGASVGSAGWIVDAALARRGHPLLAADLHFPPSAPSHVYEAHLRGGALEVAGATLPGIPAFWAGFNPHAAWAALQVPVVVADLFEETIFAQDGTRFLDAGRWRPLATRSEKIAVAGGGEETLLVRATSRGPLLDALAPEAGRPVSLHWSGALGGGVDGLVRLAHAESAAEAREALRAHVEPVVSVVFVDAAGAGGLQLAGFVPQRAMPSGLQPVPASNSAYEWSHGVSADELPARLLGAGHPWIVSADAGLPLASVGIELMWRPGARAERVSELLAQASVRGPLDLAQLVAIQHDAGSAVTPRIVANVLELMKDDAQLGHEEREVLALLVAWDGVSDAASRSATAYHVLCARLLPMLLSPALGETLARAYLSLPRVQSAALLDMALARARQGGDPDAAWSDPTLVRISLRRALRETWLTMATRLGASREKWSWGHLHRVSFAPLWPGAWAGRADELGPFPIAGDATSIAVSEFRGLDDRFDADVVSGYRLLVDAGNLDQALTAFAPGQSEHAGHPHALDALPRWLLGKPGLLSTSDPVIEDGPLEDLRLVPTSPTAG